MWYVWYGTVEVGEGAPGNLNLRLRVLALSHFQHSDFLCVSVLVAD